MNKFEAETVIKETIEYANKEIEKNRKKSRRYMLAVILGFSLIIVGLIWHRPKTMDVFLVATAISDMSVEEIKEENGSLYVLLKTADEDNTVGIDHYFNESRWVKVSEHFDPDSVRIGETYSSLSIQIVIPEDVAVKNEWIDSDTLSVDMFLRDKAYNPDYLLLIDIQ